MASQRKYKRHLDSDETQPVTPRTTKYRRLHQKQKKEKMFYKRFLCASSVPRTSVHRRNVLQKIHLSDQQESNENEQGEISEKRDPQSEEDEENGPDNIEEDGGSRQEEGERDGGREPEEDGGREPEGDDGREPEGDDGRESEGDDGRESEGDDGRESEGDDGRESEGDDGREPEGHDGSGQESSQDRNKQSKKGHDDDDPVYPGAPVSKGQSLLLLMSYVLRHNLTGVALQDLLTLFNEHFPGLVPATSYFFHKANGQFGQYVPYFYCIACESCMGPETAPKICSSCKAEFDFEKNLRVGSYFLVLSLSTQIVDGLGKSDIHLNKRELIPGIVSDIQGGAEYQKLKLSGQVGADDITIMWNCDGIPVFNSTNIQLWPIQCQIIELSPRDRQGNICIPCLWFGNSKPNMITFLTAFVSQLKELQQIGIKWRDSENIEHTSKVHSLLCSSDSIARPLLRNTKQFNGKYGCDFCLHTGSGPYVWETPEPPLRTEANHFQHAMLATPDNPVMGVKGPSPLMELESFNMITGFVPEYQHSVCLGVTKQITSLWLDSKHHKEEWYLGLKVSDIDQELLAIKPPVEVTRVPRSVKDRKFWKASEYRSFLLYYALPVLNGILTKKYWNHLFLLVFAMQILLQDAIKVSHVDVAEQALRKFVFNFEKLYGAANAIFNVHLLMHLAASVRSWGPLWATSTFPFESFNGTLLTFFNGTTNVPTQIVKRFLRWRGLSTKAGTTMANANDSTRKLFEKLQSSSGLRKKSNEFQKNVRGFGCPKKGSTSVLQRMAIKHFLGVIVHSGLFYDRFICCNVVYHSYNNTTLKKRNNSIVQLSDGTFCEIMSLMAFTCIDGASVASQTHSFCVLVKELAKSGRKVCRDVQLNISSTFLNEVSFTNNVFAVHPQSLKRKCILVRSKDKMYVIPLPNNVERD